MICYLLFHINFFQFYCSFLQSHWKITELEEKKTFLSMFLKKGGKLQKIAISDYKNPLLVVLPHVLLHHPSEEQQLWNSRSKHSMVPWDHRREIIRGSWNLRTDV